MILSCPDGLAHALSEQNIRLQQIIYEHKVGWQDLYEKVVDKRISHFLQLREEALQRELDEIRMALLKRICQQCNNNQDPSSHHEEQVCLDNVCYEPPSLLEPAN